MIGASYSGDGSCGTHTEAVAVCGVATAFGRSSSPRGEQAPCWAAGAY